MKLLHKLETKRLILRRLIKDDFNAFFNLISSEGTTKNLYLPKEFKEINKIQNLFNSLINSYNSSDSVMVLAVENKENKYFMGFCGFKFFESTCNVFTFYALLPEYRSCGYGIEFMKKLFEYAFLRLELPKITAFINPHSSQSWKLAERIGMKYMGHIKYKNFNPDPMFFTIEKKEFESQRAY